MKKTLATVVAATMLAVLTACSGGSKATEPLSLGVGVDVASFAAYDSAVGNQSVYYQLIYGSLINLGPDGKLLPGIAEKWSYDEPKTTLTLNLRSGLKFADGSKLDAAAVVANLKRWGTGKAGEGSLLGSMESAKASDDTTVVIKLKEIDPAFLFAFTRGAGFIENPNTFGASDEAKNPGGSGPYVLDAKKSTFGSKYVFTPNKNFYDQSAIKFTEVDLQVLSDGPAAVNALKTGKIDGFLLPGNDLAAQLKGASGVELATQETDWSGILFSDRGGALGSPIKDVRVRKAISMAFDRQAVVQAFEKGAGSPTGQIFPKSSAGYDAALDKTYSYDVAGAKALLAEAGYPNGFDLKMPSLTFFTGEAQPALVKQILSEIGIRVTYTDYPSFDPFLGAVFKPTFAAQWFQLERSANDWQFLNFQVSPKATFNLEKYTDPKVTELLDKIRVADDASAAALLKELNTYLVDQAWFVPVYAKQAIFAYNAKKIAVVPTPGNVWPFLANITPAK